MSEAGGLYRASGLSCSEELSNGDRLFGRNTGTEGNGTEGKGWDIYRICDVIWREV